ncbi:MAG: DUF6089 family protein [Bacteroidales bacterium]
MKRVFLLLFVIVFLSPLASGQLWKLRRYEIFGGFGTSQVFGDIGGYSPGDNLLGLKDFTIAQNRFNIKGGMRYRVKENLAVSFSLNYGYLHAADTKGSNVERAYESSTSLFEPMLTAEYYFLKNDAESSYRFVRGDEVFHSFIARLDAFVYTGIGSAIYKVKPNDKLATVIEKDSGVALAIPVGFGVNYLLSPNTLVGFDLGLRYTGSDYIDGYTSQYSSSNDVYYFMTFVLTKKLKTTEKGLPSFRKEYKE